ncbi:hypothetical protein [Bacillus thuringiensis]|uniref:hypothetical protein n=1 Tax=Bacillus thuringiensis TaxID=1428 RepID=UPI00077E1B53|nr:hypothetical protein [Bacillus thuringiensis]AMR05752.1 hypothetical protein AXW78_26965 [Bacillus thuringiensis]PNK35975.1 hypothetical protein CBR55_22945 [Bacillus thuringiensis]
MTIATSLINKAAIDGIKRLQQDNPSISTLFNNLNEYGELILIGGAVRDFTYQKSPRDFDIIVNSNLTNFDKAFEGYNYRKNRFDGYKIFINDIELDIWSIQNNWAFKEKILKTRVDNITKGTFYNFDAISINLNTSDVYAENFIESIKEKVLDITLEDDYIPLNPSPEVNIMRALVIKKYWGLNFSKKVNNYIHNWLTEVDSPYDLLIKTEIKHYGNRKLTIEDYKMIL